MRVVYDVFGAEALTRLDLTGPLLWLAAACILYGSLRARSSRAEEAPGLLDHQPGVLRDPRRRAARTDRRGGRLVHLVHQGLMKVTLFYCAGNFAETTGIHRIREMDGVGRRMPGPWRRSPSVRWA